MRMSHCTAREGAPDHWSAPDTGRRIGYAGDQCARRPVPLTRVFGEGGFRGQGGNASALDRERTRIDDALSGRPRSGRLVGGL